MINFRTDMADERINIFKATRNEEGDIPGIETLEKEENKNIKTTIVKITAEEAARKIRKPIGTYITFDLKN